MPRGHVVLGGELRDVFTVVKHGAVARSSVTGDGAEQRGLAGAVGAEQRHDLALFDFEVDAEQHLHGAVGHVDVFADEQLRVPGQTRRTALLLGQGRRRGRANVVVDGLACRGKDERADGEDRGEQHDPGADAVGIAQRRRAAGATKMPGRMNTAPAPNANERACAGTTSEITALIVGAKNDKASAATQPTATDNHNHGDTAITPYATAGTSVMTPPMVMTRLGRRAMTRLPMLPPINTPTRLKTCDSDKSAAAVESAEAELVLVIDREQRGDPEVGADEEGQ